MASIFHNYGKEGKGVEKDEKKKRGLALFGQLFTRKFWSYMLLNMIYCISTVPGICVVWFVLYGILADMAGFIREEDYPFLLIGVLIGAICIGLIFSLSPLSSGYYYILRRYTDEEHAWVISDFFGEFKANWKRSVALYVIDLVIITFVLLSLRLYILLIPTHTYMVSLVTVIAIAFIIYAVMVPYKWIQLVTVNLKLKDIFKNSLFMSLGVLKVTVTYILMTVFYCIVVFYLLAAHFSFGIIYMFLLGFAVFGLLQAIATYPTVKRHIVEPAQKEYYSEED